MTCRPPHREGGLLVCCPAGFARSTRRVFHMVCPNTFIGCGAHKLHRWENARPETAESSVPHSAPRLWFSSALVSPPLFSSGSGEKRGGETNADENHRRGA